jgi:uncharacterized protein YjdB
MLSLLLVMLVVMSQPAAVQAAGSPIGAAAVPVVWISLNKASDIISLDSQGVVPDTDQLTAAILPANATNQAVSWKSDDAAVATVDQAGLVTAVALGMAHITATTQDGNFTATCAVTVNNGSSTGNTPNGCPPAPELTIKSGYTGGNYTTLQTFTPGELGDPSKFKQVQQTYTFIDNMPAPVLDSCQGVLLSDILSSIGISLDKVHSFSFYTEDVPSIVGAYTTFTEPKLYETEYCYPNLTNSNNYQVVNGVFTPNDPDASSGAIQVYPMIALEDHWKRFATTPDFADMNGDTQFRLVYGEADDTTHDASTSAKWVFEIDVTLSGTPVTGVTLDKSSDAIAPGATDQLTATVAPSNATNPSVTWTSSNPSVATVSSSGLVTAVASGTATIAATTQDGSFFAICPVTVQAGVAAIAANVPVTGVTLNKNGDTIAAGSSDQLVATVAPANATNQNVTWSSDNTTVATVDQTGKVAALTAGTANITATTADGGHKVTCAVTVGASQAGGATPGSATATPAAATFSDVPASYWANGVIDDLSGKGYINGYPDGTFRPDETITRAEFVAMLAKILKLPAYNPAQPDFSDVSQAAWCYGAVEQAVHAGVVKGNGGSFDPSDPITREQMAVMTAKAAGIESGAAAVSFADSGQIGAWAAGAVTAVVQDGIMKGYPDGTFGPGKGATRAEAAVVIARAFKQ